MNMMIQLIMINDLCLWIHSQVTVIVKKKKKNIQLQINKIKKLIKQNILNSNKNRKITNNNQISTIKLQIKKNNKKSTKLETKNKALSNIGRKSKVENTNIKVN